MSTGMPAAVAPGSRGLSGLRRVQQLLAGPLQTLGPALLAAALAAAAVLAGFHGPDVAAQVYRSVQVRLHGITLWDVGWYGGNYPLGYSVLSPLVGATIGLTATAVVSTGISALAFDRLLVGRLGRRPVGTWYFAVSMLVEVAVGQYPFLLGQAFGLLAVLACVHRRWRLAVLLGFLCALSSPVDAVFVVLAMAAWLVATWSTRPDQRLPLVAVAAVSILPIGVIGLVFPGTGNFPDSAGALAGVIALCVLGLTPLVEAPRELKIAAVLYGLAAIAVFAVANPLGNNVTRLGTDIGVPLLICFLAVGRRWRVALLTIPFVLWQWAPGVGALRGSGDVPSTQAGFYQPLVKEVMARSHHLPVRIEIPPTLDHWEAAYVAPHIPLARGWERQLDIADNPIFYKRGALTPASYHRWLLDNGVRYIALPRAPLDYAALGEARLLQQHTLADLRLVWHSAQWQLWRVTDSPGLVSGPGRIVALTPDRVVLQVSRPGALVVRVRYTSYWSLDSPSACVARSAQGWTAITDRAAGTLTLSVSVLPSSRDHC